MTETLYLIRHATPDWSRSDLVYHLPPGPPLTVEGQQQAAAVGAYLLLVNVRQFFSSPLERCLHTAQIAAGIAGASITMADGLIEWQPAEQTLAVQDRMRPVLEQAITACQKTGPVALFTHGGPIGALLLELGMDEPTLVKHRIFDHHNPVPPAGAWRAQRVHPGAAWELDLTFKPEAVSL